MPCKNEEENGEEPGAQSKQPTLDPIDLVSPSWEEQWVEQWCAVDHRLGGQRVCPPHSPSWSQHPRTGRFQLRFKWSLPLLFSVTVETFDF